jgi:hypothetical protein
MNFFARRVSLRGRNPPTGHANYARKLASIERGLYSFSVERAMRRFNNLLEWQISEFV